MSAVLEFPVVPAPLQEDEQPSLERLMDKIQGQDHKALAAVLHYRVGQLEDKVDTTGEHVRDVAIKMESLIGAHRETQDAVRGIHGRLDAHIDGQSETPTTVVALLGKHPWLIPVLLVLGATMFGSTAFLAFLER
jgi:hypothetical protein